MLLSPVFHAPAMLLSILCKCQAETKMEAPTQALVTTIAMPTMVIASGAQRWISLRLTSTLSPWPHTSVMIQDPVNSTGIVIKVVARPTPGTLTVVFSVQDNTSTQLELSTRLLSTLAVDLMLRVLPPLFPKIPIAGPSMSVMILDTSLNWLQENWKTNLLFSVSGELTGTACHGSIAWLVAVVIVTKVVRWLSRIWKSLTSVTRKLPSLLIEYPNLKTFKQNY